MKYLDSTGLSYLVSKIRSLFKGVQSAVSDPTASGTGITFIDSITQNANGEITATKKTVQDASSTQSGIVSTGSQSFAGSKTFNDNMWVNGNLNINNSDAQTQLVIGNNSENTGMGLLYLCSYGTNPSYLRAHSDVTAGPFSNYLPDGDGTLALQHQKVNFGTVSSLPISTSNDRVYSNWECVKAVLGTPSAQTGDWTVTTTDYVSGSNNITLSGSISGSTTVVLYMAPIA